MKTAESTIEFPTNPENTEGRVNAITSTRDKTRHLGVLEHFVPTREHRRNGMRRCFGFAYTRGNASGITQVFLSVVHQSGIMSL